MGDCNETVGQTIVVLLGRQWGIVGWTFRDCSGNVGQTVRDSIPTGAGAGAGAGAGKGAGAGVDLPLKSDRVLNITEVQATMMITRPCLRCQSELL